MSRAEQACTGAALSNGISPDLPTDPSIRARRVGKRCPRDGPHPAKSGRFADRTAFRKPAIPRRRTAVVANPEGIRDDASPGVGAPEMAEGGGSDRTSGRTSAVFISYASRDATVAATLTEALERRGIACWVAPRDVKPGAQYADSIVGAINEARVVVLLLSQYAVASSHVGREVERAASKRKPIIAFRIDAATLSRALEYFLSQSQWIDVPAIGMPTALVKLTEAVEHGSLQSVPADPIDTAKLPARTAGRTKLILGVAVLIAVAVAAAAGAHFWSQRHKGAPPAATVAITDKSIAVLPFVDMSEKKDQEYFADGMAEEILNLLVKVPELKVIGRTSSFQFKGQKEDLRKIGTALGAAYVVEGSVRRSANHIRVTAQLIDSRDGTHRWSGTYDREASDTLKVQDEIATSLVRALQLEVTSSRYHFLRSPPRNGEAYDLYLRGLHAEDRFDEGGLHEAIADFRHALEIDPSFVSAAEALAWALFALADTQNVSPQTGFENTRAAAEAALKLDPRSAQAHTILCLVHIEYDWDWPAAEQEVKKALELAPNTPPVLTCAAEYAIALGQWADALAFIDAAIAADPLDGNIYRLRGYSCLRLNRYTDAESAFRRALEISPTEVWGRYFVAMAMLTAGNAEAALAEMQKEPDAAGRDGALVVIYQTLHRPDDAARAFARLKAEGTERWPFGLAFASAVRGETDQAFSWLEKAYAGRDPSLWAIKGHPYLRSLERDSRYRTFLRKMNLPE
jgi:TolB-like protein